MTYLKTIALVAATAGFSMLASAAPVTATYDSFGSYAVPGDFGSHGIPTDAVATTNIDGAVLALTAAQRYYAFPGPTNNGAGVFSARTGVSTDQPTYGFNNLALWNFGFYVSPSTSTQLTYKLFVDVDSSAGNDLSTYLAFNVNGNTVGAYAPNGAPYEDYTNLGFFSGSFDPTSGGEYGIVLATFNDAGAEVGRAAILVNAVPEPASIALVGIALVGIAGAGRRRRS